MESKSAHKIHLGFIYTLYTQPEVNLYNIFNNFVHETKFMYTEPSKRKQRCHILSQSIWTVCGYVASQSFQTLILYAISKQSLSYGYVFIHI